QSACITIIAPKQNRRVQNTRKNNTHHLPRPQILEKPTTQVSRLEQEINSYQPTRRCKFINFFMAFGIPNLTSWSVSPIYAFHN
ncbi:MAG: hypothetical protein VX978_07435, partial [Pseudomonadota bacterium]|nr:hypothetical protein [Pseudomonadota bacterium]